MRINNNIMALNTHRQFSINNDNVSNSTEKLSSGFRINRAGDDAAGLAISEKMRAQIRGLEMAAKNSQDAISLVQTAEGALTETHAILQKMRELSVQSASDTNEESVDRAALDAVFQELKAEIDDIAEQTKFNEMHLLNGDFGVTVNYSIGGTDFEADPEGITNITVMGAENGDEFEFEFADDELTISRGNESITLSADDIAKAKTDGAITWKGAGLRIEFSASYDVEDLDNTSITVSKEGTGAFIQTGANKDDTLTISINDMRSDALNIKDAEITTRDKASNAIETVNAAINQVSTQRAKLGAYQNRLEHKIKNLNTSAENLQAAESRIRDLDMAKEMTAFTKNSILVQASTAMLAQANSAPQVVLSLLR